MSKRLVGVSMVKNEADIIEANVRHNLRYLDRMIVLDHDSTDTTAGILRALAEEGLPLTLIRMVHPDPKFKQSLCTTQLAYEAFEKHEADYVVPLDADEFLHVPSRQMFEDALERANAEVMCLSWQTYVPGSEAEQGHPVQLLRWRVEADRKPLPKIVLSRQVMTEKNWYIGLGNHVFFQRVGSDLNWSSGELLPEMKLAHLPLRSPAQLIAKALVGWLARKLEYGASAETASNSWHLRELYRCILEGNRITNEHVRDYAIAVYALGSAPTEADVAQVKLIEAPFAEPMPLRYTPDEPVDPARLLAAWSSLLVDRVVQMAPRQPVGDTAPSER